MTTASPIAIFFRLVGLVGLAILVVLPLLLELAAAPFH